MTGTGSYVTLLLSICSKMDAIAAIYMRHVRVTRPQAKNKRYLGGGGVPGGHLPGAVGLLLVGDLDGGGPLVQEAAGREQAAVPHPRLLLKVLAHAVPVVVVANAGLLWTTAETYT